MAPGSGPDGVVPTPEARAIQELAAARREMVAAVTRQIRFSIEQLQLSPQEAAARVREWLAHAPADQEADQVTWFDLAGLIEHDPERGQAAWQTLKDEARQELATGFRAARTWSPRSRGGRTSGRRSWSSSRRCARRSNRAMSWRSYWCSTWRLPMSSISGGRR